MPVPFKGNYIGGRFTRPTRGTQLISEDPGDLFQPVGSFVVSPDVVGDAVESARKAFSRWGDLSLLKRLAFLKAFARIVRKRSQEFSTLIAMEAGKPIFEARREVARLITKVDEIAVDGLRFIHSFRVSVTAGVRGECRYRPLGVLAVIGPFNFPAHTPASHIIPALLTGNAVIFKPSEYTPFVGQMLAECFHAAGIPAGVFNLVQGEAHLGAQLVAHPTIAGVLFTGSTAAGQAIKEATLKEPQKSLALEMGGKNAILVLSDADLELAALEAVVAAFSMAGQRCNAASRLIVEKSVAKRFLPRFLELAKGVTIGYPLEEGVLMGPLISHDAVAKFQRYMRMAQEEGFATLLAGRALGHWGKRRGYYVSPSVHLIEEPTLSPSTGSGRTEVKSLHYRREEIFGPDVAIELAKNEEEAVALNNEVPYGLITSVFTKSRGRFERLFPKIDTGMVNLNRGTIHSSGKLPFGGTKASGSFKPAGVFSATYCTTPVAFLEDRRPLKRRSLPL